MEHKKISGKNLANLALTSGIIALIAICFPPWQLLFGASTVLLAHVSKGGQKHSTTTTAATVLGIVAIVCSFFVFSCTVSFLDNMHDPANAELYRPYFDTVQTLVDYLNSLVPQQ